MVVESGVMPVVKLENLTLIAGDRHVLNHRSEGGIVMDDACAAVCRDRGNCGKSSKGTLVSTFI